MSRRRMRRRADDSRRESVPAAMRLPRKISALRKTHAMNDELLAVERRKCSGPGLKAAPAIVEFVRAARRKIHSPVFAIEHWRKACAFVILRLRLDRPIGEPGQRLHNQRRTRMRKHIEQVHRSLMGAISTSAASESAPYRDLLQAALLCCPYRRRPWPPPTESARLRDISAAANRAG
jgi:hypothetical protein